MAGSVEWPVLYGASDDCRREACHSHYRNLMCSCRQSSSATAGSYFFLRLSLLSFRLKRNHPNSQWMAAGRSPCLHVWYGVRGWSRRRGSLLLLEFSRSNRRSWKTKNFVFFFSSNFQEFVSTYRGVLSFTFWDPPTRSESCTGDGQAI